MIGRWSAVLAMALLAPLARAADASLDIVAETPAGGTLAVRWRGPGGATDFISIDPVGAPDGSYGPYAYPGQSNPVAIDVPDQPGDYVVRYHLGSSGYAVIASAPLRVTDVTATLAAPASVAAGAEVAVKWSGPNAAGDFISIDKADDPERTYGPYAYPSTGNPVVVKAPDRAGDYLLRYHMASSYRVIGSTPLTVGAVDATLSAPDAVTAGARFDVAWSGPGHAGDFISVDAANAPERDYGNYGYPHADKPLSLTAPDEAGDYELRYHMAQSYQVIAKRPIVVQPATATVSAPAEVVAGSIFEVSWSGPDNEGDFVTLVEAAAPARSYGSSNGYTRRGNPARLEAPKTPGDYELRYLTGQRYVTLATARLKVAPGSTPGSLRVVATAAPQQRGAIELLLDASGSMLKRIGGQRRIDLAKQALLDLINNVLPNGSGFALRVFGHKQANSCRTDLEIPYAPLDRRAAAERIGALTAMNLARTPIAASLSAVAQDLAAATGARIVVLVTDGEETCDGNPRQAVEALRAGGADVRVNIVGFAVDEVALKETFAEWARHGGGGFYSAQNGAELQQAIRAALNPAFEVLAGSDVVATGAINGDPVELPPGKYAVRLRDAASRDVGTVTITSGATQELKID